MIFENFEFYVKDDDEDEEEEEDENYENFQISTYWTPFDREFQAD